MENVRDSSALKDDFLAAHHSILFSKTSENDADAERRLLAVKYTTARKFESEETAALLLDQGLERYERLLEKTGFFGKIKPVENAERIGWKSSLKYLARVESLAKPLPCQRDSSDEVCGRRALVDRDVENLTKLSERTEDYSKNRKLSSARREGAGTIENKNQTIRPTFCRSENEYPAKDRSGNPWEKEEDEETRKEPRRAFRTAKAELRVQRQQQQQQQQRSTKKTLGGKATINSQFVCPLKRERDREDERTEENWRKETDEPEDDRLKGIDEKLIQLVRNEIMDSGKLVSWEDVAGLEHAKKIIKEIVVLPMLRPDIFTGLRRPPKGILLFGPPGTGKTLIGKCIASQSRSTFFSISASSLTSKWIGEGEKMVRALFAVARVHQPSVIFIDEIDSLLTQRSETEHESSRRIKTEFLVQLDGAATGDEDRILVIGATNRPQELDEAARRRFVKRLYIPLPELNARRRIVENLLAAVPHQLEARDIDRIAESSEHYSGADMTNLCKEASMGPIRSIPFEMLENISKEDVRRVTAEDFAEALVHVRPSVSHNDLGLYVDWDRTYGSGTASLPKNNLSR